MEIRAHEPHDAPALALLLGKLGYPASSDQAAEHAAAYAAHPGAAILVAVEDGAVVGVAATGVVRS